MIITMNFDQSKIWAGERLCFFIEGAYANQEITIRFDNDNSYRTTYNADANGWLVIDITDFVRVYAPSEYELYNANNELIQGGTFDYCNSGGGEGSILARDPHFAHIPAHECNVGALIVPPSKILGMSRCEFYNEIGVWTLTAANSKFLDNRSAQIEDACTFTNEDTHESFTRNVTPLDCERRYARVLWTSQFGVKRNAYFEVIEFKQAAQDDFELQRPTRELNATKGMMQSVKLRIDGLDLYDLWYYGDVILSGDVQVLVLDQNNKEPQTIYTDELNADRLHAVVTDKNITVPTGEKGFDGKLEITLNTREYDAVIM